MFFYIERNVVVFQRKGRMEQIEEDPVREESEGEEWISQKDLEETELPAGDGEEGVNENYMEGIREILVYV